MTNDEYRAETIRAALAGDAEAGREALSLCRDGLAQRRLHPEFADYLAARINDILDGVPPDKALCIARERGRPRDATLDWKKNLGALAALLHLRMYKPKQIAIALCDERAALHNKPLEESDAHKIRVEWKALQDFGSEKDGEEMLLHLAGPYRKVLSKYPQLK